MKEQVAPGVYKLTLRDSKGKLYTPKNPYEAFRIVRVNGESKKKWKCFRSFKEAKEFHAETEDRVEKTLREVLAHFFEHGTSHMENATVAKLQTQIVHLESLLGKAVADIDGRVLNEWLTRMGSAEYLAEHPRKYTYENELRLLAQVFGYYRENFDRDFVSPLTGALWKKAVVRKLARVEKDLSAEQFVKFLGAIRCEQIRTMAEVHYLTYARIGEVAALHVGDFSTENGVILLRRRVVWPKHSEAAAFVLDGLKASDRKVIVSSYVAGRLAEWCANNGVSEGLVFHKQGSPLGYSYIRDRYNAAFKIAGINASATHILRHASLSEHREVTGDVFETMKAAGHKNIDTTLRYAKHRTGASADAQGKVETKFRLIKSQVG